MSEQFPESSTELLATSARFRQVLAEAKSLPPPPPPGWYPYDTMSSIDQMADIIERNFALFERGLRAGPMLDVGCGDGDLSFLFASMGCEVTAIDNPPTNYNWMRGVALLRERLKLPVDIEPRDLDAQFDLPARMYGFALLLGILYHLKNPFHILEKLARRCRYCFLSTRIAAVTPLGTNMQTEPLAYLLGDRETNNDSTNYWIFSETALVRLVNRSGWRVLDRKATGCTDRPNPVDADRDGRMFMFLQSEVCSAPASIQLLEGWYDVSEEGWAWTAKRFSFEVTLEEQLRPLRFALEFLVPGIVVAASPVRLRCAINGTFIGAQQYSREGHWRFEAALPESVDHRCPLQFEFAVDHSFIPSPPETRELGVVISFGGKIYGVSQPIPFWLA